MKPPEFTTLKGQQVELVPLAPEHAPALFELGREPAIWKYLPGGAFASVDDALHWIQSMLARFEASGEVAFCVRDLKTNEIAGSTSLLSPLLDHGGIEIGFTWYGVDFQHTHVNTDTKRTLLSHCFDNLKAIRVQLKTDGRNLRSQHAIERLGAKREGVLRSNYRYSDGFVRDSVMYSILQTEWQTVRDRLDQFLESNSC